MDNFLKIVDPQDVHMHINVLLGQRCNIGPRTEYTAIKVLDNDRKTDHVKLYPYDVGIFIGLGRWGKQVWRYSEIAVFKRVGRVSLDVGVLHPTTIARIG